MAESSGNATENTDARTPNVCLYEVSEDQARRILEIVQKSLQDWLRLKPKKSRLIAQKICRAITSEIKPIHNENAARKEELQELDELERTRLTESITDARCMTESLAKKIESSNAHLTQLSEQASEMETKLKTATFQLDTITRQNRQLAEHNDWLLGKFCTKMEQRLSAESTKGKEMFKKMTRRVKHDPELVIAIQNLSTTYDDLHDELFESMVSNELVREELQRCKRKLQISVEKHRKDNYAAYKMRVRLNAQLVHSCSREEKKLRNLRKNLDDMEAVQKKLVEFSQSLQVALEKLRIREGEVRLQHPDDFDECNNCNVELESEQKFHCSHCLRIHCEACISTKVPSGPSKRLFHVCTLCHFLVNKDCAPVF